MIEAVGHVARAGGTAAPRPVRVIDATARVEPAAPLSAVRVDRRSDFLAHLIAVRDDAAQTRQRRRGTPEEAARAYGAAAKLAPARGSGVIVEI